MAASVHNCSRASKVLKTVCHSHASCTKPCNNPLNATRMLCTTHLIRNIDFSGILLVGKETSNTSLFKSNQFSPAAHIPKTRSFFFFQMGRSTCRLIISYHGCSTGQKYNQNGCIPKALLVSKFSHKKSLLRDRTYVAAAMKISAVLALLKHEIPTRRKSIAKKVHNTRGRLLEIACMMTIGTGRIATRIHAIKIRVAKCNTGSENM
jgi:hypothetical protein